MHTHIGTKIYLEHFSPKRADLGITSRKKTYRKECAFKAPGMSYSDCQPLTGFRSDWWKDLRLWRCRPRMVTSVFSRVSSEIFNQVFDRFEMF